MDARNIIAARAAKELQNGNVVNLGIGIPTRVVDFIPHNIEIHLHSENGILGLGPTPGKDKMDPDLVNAGKLPVTVKRGASYFDSATSFSMIRGGHIDVAILGVLQVDRYGRIANWAIPGENILGVGGAMDLLKGSKKVIVTTFHRAKNGKSKIVNDLTYPLTSSRKVDVIITDMAVFHVKDEGLLLTEVMKDYSVEDVKKYTDAEFAISDKLFEIERGK